MTHPALADVTFSTEAVVIVGGLMAALAGAVTFLHRALMLAKDEQIKAITSRADSYLEIAREAVDNLEAEANRQRAARGKPPFVPVPPVVPEHNSPTTAQQQDTADLQTMRARLVAATLELGLPARKASAQGRGE